MQYIVWFKKDLRLSDHAPLVWSVQQARQTGGSVIALWVDEPAMWQQADQSARHWYFANECLHELAAQIAQSGGQLLRLRGEMLQVLNALREKLGIFTLASHEETGNGWSYARDLAVADWCRAQGVLWREFENNAVVRRLLSHGGGRNRWSAHWQARMEALPLDTPSESSFDPPSPLPWATLPFEPQTAPTAQEIGVAGQDAAQRQRGGSSQAQEALFSFLMLRGQHYRSAMSSPLAGAQACSRISPYLAWGSLSIREAVYATWARRAQLLAMPAEERPVGFLQSLKSFEGRLHWHCHFIQKLESEPAIELRNVHRGFDGLRNEADLLPQEHEYLQAWCEGRTGYPFIDACMRSLIATGWLNFRMRAMLMSFASYHLWLHWRQTGLHLARLFLDYEPGIHWSQSQMQSGVTGINTVRIYNPVKQSHDQDPGGVFIRRWVPELRDPKVCSDTFIHEPWRMPNPPAGYAAPIVDAQQAARAAKEKIYLLKARQEVKTEAQRVYQKHGSRNPTREGVRKTQAVRQRKRSAPSVSVAQDEQLSLGF
jgi:deoxyribodipyrimidine photo-lyase